MTVSVIEIKAFVPAKDYELSKCFYQDIGFNLASDTAGVAYFYLDNSSFLLQDFYEPQHCENFMMHLLVDDITRWHDKVTRLDVKAKYQLQVSEISQQPWGMLDFTLKDPGGVLWRIGQNNTV